MSALRARRFVTAMLWLVLALLVLHAPANAAMHAAAPAGPLPAAQSAALPCHGGADHAGVPAGDQATTPASPCAMCDLCHAAVAVSSACADSVAFVPPRVAVAPVLDDAPAPPPRLRPPRS
jgi:hypothetical protein